MFCIIYNMNTVDIFYMLSYNQKCITKQTERILFMDTKEKQEMLLKQIPAQLNLLAFNMALEAGRAGNNGRGLAIVAEETQSLAIQCMEAIEHNDKPKLYDIGTWLDLLAQNSMLEVTYMLDSIGTQAHAALIITEEMHIMARLLKGLIPEKNIDIMKEREYIYKIDKANEDLSASRISTNSMNNHIIATVGDFLVGFRIIKFVREILHAPKSSSHVEDVNNKDIPYIIGLLDLRGVKIPIIDLQARLGLGVTKWNGEKESRIIICMLGERFVSFLVKNIRNLTVIPSKAWEKEDAFMDINPLFLKSCCDLKAGKLHYLNFNSVIDTAKIEEFMSKYN